MYPMHSIVVLFGPELYYPRSGNIPLRTVLFSIHSSFFGKSVVFVSVSRKAILGMDFRPIVPDPFPALRTALRFRELFDTSYTGVSEQNA